MPGIILVPFLLISTLIQIIDGGYPPTNGGGYSDPGPHGGYGGYQEVKKYPYLPAPPGETPGCAKHGATYCEKIETYPMEVISYLLYKWGRTYQQFIASETNKDYIPISKEYGPVRPQPHPQPLPYDSYYPKDTGGYLPPHLPLGNGNNNATGGGHHNKQFVDSYFRKRQPGGYDYSFAVGQESNNHYNRNNGQNPNFASTMAAAAAAHPPLLHSVWWNHRDTSGAQSFPHMTHYNRDGWGQRWRRRVKRQAENTLCPTRSEFITPQAAMNMEGNWMYVVNMENSAQYRQQVRSEVCARGSGSPCDNVCSVAPGLSATCQQKYVQKRLVALDGSGGSLRGDIFWFPHCCSCNIS